MKICVFSDIHGNSLAFQNALKQILSEDADLNYHLGDLCGYFFGQLEAYEMLKTIPRLVALLGNHDRTFLDIVDGDQSLLTKYTKRYGRSMELLLGRDFRELRGWLEKLPQFNVNTQIKCYACHGSPWNNIEGYVYPDTNLIKFEELEHDFFILGHTHYPMVRRINHKLVINPGSIGQPRHGGPPTYAVIDIHQKKVSFKEISYDRKELADQIEELDRDNEYLKKIIWRNEKNA